MLSELVDAVDVHAIIVAKRLTEVRSLASVGLKHARTYLDDPSTVRVALLLSTDHRRRRDHDRHLIALGVSTHSTEGPHEFLGAALHEERE